MRRARKNGGLCRELLMLAEIPEILVMVFALLILALSRSSNQTTKRGIYQDLESTFDFNGLQALSSRADFKDTMGKIAASSKVRP